MKTLKEYYQEVLAKVETHKPEGICVFIKMINPNQSERDFILNDFRERLPGFFSWEYHQKEFVKKGKRKYTSYWWVLTEEGKARRIKFLKKIIKSL